MIGPALRRWIGCLGLPGLLLAASCVSPRAPERREPAVRSLPRIEGSTFTGWIEPGEPALFSISLEAGEYLEVQIDRPPEEIWVDLFAPDPQEVPGRWYNFGERAPGTTGQVLWKVTAYSGLHHLRLSPKTDGPATFALTVRELHPATPRNRSAQRGDELWGEADALWKAGRLRDALELFDQAFEHCQEGGYVRGMASTYSRRAKILHAFGRPEEAREQLLAALDIWQDLGELGSIAGTFVMLANLERDASNWEEMNRYLEMAQGMALELDDREVQVNSLVQYCKAELDQGRTEEALATCSRALELCEEAGLAAQTIDALINLGYIHFYRGELDRARAYYARALELQREHPDPVREATLGNNLALLHEAAGEYQTALAYFQEALDAYEDLGRQDFSGKVLLNMGQIHQQRLANVALAGELYRQALARMVEAGDVLGRIGVLHALGELQAEQGELTEARGTLEQALGLSRTAGSRTLLAGSLARIGELHLRERNSAAALEPLEESRELFRASEHRRGEAGILPILAEAYARVGEEERALDLLFEAASLNEAIGDRAGLAESHYRIARIERDRGDLAAARSAIEQAEAVVDAVRLLIGTDDLRALFSATTRPYHELHVEILMAQHRQRPEGGHDAEALRESERARARSLLEILAEADLELGPEVPPELLAERADLQARLFAKEIERQKLLAEESADATSLFRVKLDLEGLLTRLRETERRIRAASPRYAALTHPQPVTVGEIQRSLLDGETALLEYSLGEERSFLWVVSEHGFRSHELAGQAEIERAAHCFHWLITAYGEPPAAEALAPEESACLGERLASYRSSPAGGHSLALRRHRRREIAAAFERSGAELSALVLAPAVAGSPLPYRLAVVSDGALEYVPFAALPEPGRGGRPLVAAHELVRLPSASVLALQRTQPGPVAAPAGELAVVADPVYAADDPRVADRSREAASEIGPEIGGEERGSLGRFRRLDFSGEEAAAIVRLAGARGTYLAEGAAASRERVLSGALSGYRYVHFATHAVVDTQYPQLSRLVLSLVDSEGRPVDDGYLRLHDIYGLALEDTDMVVLSACDTALGRAIRGEGLVGLTRGFLYAGAERVLASLWQVQDAATARLMERFYRGLLVERLPPAQALRRAQLAILEEPDGASAFPYYWGGFVLQGEWR
ncbi:MAG TPA: CHAT domain-containing protein [Thermoanaerobaculia bacterium]|nr:CHAT domain-containing protein [Thermoanaerobaculia bacterium]